MDPSILTSRALELLDWSTVSRRPGHSCKTLHYFTVFAVLYFLTSALILFQILLDLVDLILLPHVFHPHNDTNFCFQICRFMLFAHIFFWEKKQFSVRIVSSSRRGQTIPTIERPNKEEHHFTEHLPVTASDIPST